MTDEKNEPKKPQSPAGSRPKRPTTIDLKATEISPEADKLEPEAAKAAQPGLAEPAASQAGSTEDQPQRDHLQGAQDPMTKDWPWPVIGIAAAAAIVFFAIGIGAGQWLLGPAIPQAALVPAAPAPVVAQPSPELLARIAKVESEFAAQPKNDAQLQSRVAKLEAALNAPRPDDPQVLARVAAAEATVKALSDMLASRERRNDDIAAIAHEARDRASNAVTAAEAAKKESRGASPDSRADLDALATKVTTLEQSARAAQAELARRITADDAKSRLAIAAIALRDAVDSGMPFTAELAAVKSLSADATVVAPLEPLSASGVPSAAALGRELAGIMPEIFKVVRKDEPQQGSFLERLQSNAAKIVRIRPAGEVAGDDAASVSARIELRADNADIRGALAELAKLPPDARAPADAWIKKAEARNAAIAASRNLSQTALAALAKPGS